MDNRRPGGAGEGEGTSSRPFVDLAILGLLVGAITGGLVTTTGDVSGLAVLGVVLAAGAVLGSVLAVPTLLRVRGR